MVLTGISDLDFWLRASYASPVVDTTNRPQTRRNEAAKSRETRYRNVGKRLVFTYEKADISAAWHASPACLSLT
jgi:hypothetical protein